MSTPPAAESGQATLAWVAAPGRLAAAWADVLASDLDDGVLGAGVSRFREDAEENLAQIAADLRAGGYEPGPLTPAGIPRPDGRLRTLHIPAVRDRVVERSVLAALTPVIDPLLGPFSYAYRPGLGVADAVQAVAALRDEGLRWVARSDFPDCFGSVPVLLLRRMLPALIEDPGLLALVGALLNRRATARGAAAVVQGLVQGSPLSPLWANLVLAGSVFMLARNVAAALRRSCRAWDQSRNAAAEPTRPARSRALRTAS